MLTQTIPLEETDCFSKSFIDYVKQKKDLAPFFGAYPSIENFKGIIENRNFPNEQRNILASALTRQYDHLTISEAVSSNIDRLKDSKTFTITTGHQLNIFTGPLYFIYKIVTVINACKALKTAYPDYHFVPVYWMASEDHDFEEISYFNFEGKKWEWKTDQIGAVGRFDPAELREMAGQLPKGAAFFEEAYSEQTLANAARHYANYLFGEEGLVVVDGDEAELKKALIPVIEDDLFIHKAEELASKTSASLEELGYKAQVYPRQINFFYLKGDIRERIEKSEEGFEVLDTDITFSEKEIKDLIANHPEHFSPNVILRPLYQELILPNLAYVGGPAETIYWLQLKAVFDHFNTPFPALMPRNFATIISNDIKEKWSKTGLKMEDLFLTTEHAFDHWVKQNTHQNLEYKEELGQLEKIHLALADKAKEIDPTLVQHLEALHASFSKKVEKAEKKLVRAEKRKFEEKKKQISAVKEALFPGNSLQERKDNFLNFYLKDPQLIQRLLDNFNAFNFEMYLIFE